MTAKLEKAMPTEAVIIHTARKAIMVGAGQFWHETKSNWELWQKKPLFLLKRVNRKRVLFVQTKW